MCRMIGTKHVVSAAFAFVVLLSTVGAQNPGSCPQDDGKYRQTSAGERSHSVLSSACLHGDFHPLDFPVRQPCNLTNLTDRGRYMAHHMR